MTGKDLLGAMSHVDEKYVDEAETQTIKKSASIGWRKWVPLAACLCVVIFGALSFGRFRNPAQPDSVADNSHMEMAQDVAQQESETPNGIHAAEEIPMTDEASMTECPSVIVRVDAWQENGFLSTVAELVDTDIFAVGTELTVTFNVETCIAFTEGDQTVYDDRVPTEADFPAGSLVLVQFVSYEEETGTIHAGILSLE